MLGASGYQISESVAPAAASIATSAGLVASGALAGSIAGPIGAAAGLLVGLALKLGEGCGNSCIQASKALQVYEVAANDIIAVAESGMISGSQAADMVSSVIQAGLSTLANLKANGDDKAQGGIDILNKEAASLVSQAGSFGKATKSYDSKVAQSLMKNPSTPNWYSDAIISGNNIAMGLLNSSISTMLSSVGGINKEWLWITAVGLIVLGIVK